jgi:hypothetical protein
VFGICVGRYIDSSLDCSVAVFCLSVVNTLVVLLVTKFCTSHTGDLIRLASCLSPDVPVKSQTRLQILYETSFIAPNYRYGNGSKLTNFT